jgi:hypothetical protein
MSLARLEAGQINKPPTTFATHEIQETVQELFEPAFRAIGMRGVLVMRETVRLAYDKGWNDALASLAEANDNTRASIISAIPRT